MIALNKTPPVITMDTPSVNKAHRLLVHFVPGCVICRIRWAPESFTLVVAHWPGHEDKLLEFGELETVRLALGLNRINP